MNYTEFATQAAEIFFRIEAAQSEKASMEAAVDWGALAVRNEGFAATFINSYAAAQEVAQ